MQSKVKGLPDRSCSPLIEPCAKGLDGSQGYEVSIGPIKVADPRGQRAQNMHSSFLYGGKEGAKNLKLGAPVYGPTTSVKKTLYTPYKILF